MKTFTLHVLVKCHIKKHYFGTEPLMTEPLVSISPHLVSYLPPILLVELNLHLGA